MSNPFPYTLPAVGEDWQTISHKNKMLQNSRQKGMAPAGALSCGQGFASYALCFFLDIYQVKNYRNHVVKK
jgi:hypothetical protein